MEISGGGERLRLSVVSRTILGFHGDALTAVCVRQDDNDERVEPLVALLKRPTNLERLNSFGRASPSTLVALLESDCLRHVWNLLL